MLLVLALHAWVMMRLPSLENDSTKTWRGLGAWMEAVLLGTGAFLGAALSPGMTEPPRTLAIIGLLCAGQLAMPLALDGMLAFCFGPARRLAGTIVLLTILFLSTAFFWSRVPLWAATSGRS